LQAIATLQFGSLLDVTMLSRSTDRSSKSIGGNEGISSSFGADPFAQGILQFSYAEREGL
jgi:hypothetical protein